MAPTFFKEVFKITSSKCSDMGFPSGDNILYTLLFTGDQVFISWHQDNLFNQSAKSRIQKIENNDKYG